MKYVLLSKADFEKTKYMDREDIKDNILNNYDISEEPPSFEGELNVLYLYIQNYKCILAVVENP